MQANLTIALAKIEELEEEVMTLRSSRDEDLARVKMEVRTELITCISPCRRDCVKPLVTAGKAEQVELQDHLRVRPPNQRRDHPPA